MQLVVYARQSLGLGSGGYGVLLTAAGAGGLVSALVNGRLATGRRISLIVIVAGSLTCATQLAYAGVQVLTIALAVTVIGNAGLVSCQVVGETALARIVPREALGRVIGTFFAVSRAAIIAGAVLAAVLVASTSLRASLVILGVVALSITLLCGLGLRGLDALNARRADALASRVKVLEGLPVTVGVPQIVLEQLAAAAAVLPAAHRASTSLFRALRRMPSTPSRKAASWCTGTARPSCISVLATASASAACSTTPPGTPPSPRRWTRRCSASKATRCSTPSRRRQACGPRSISAAPRPEYRSRPGETAVVDDPRWAKA